MYKSTAVAHSARLSIVNVLCAYGKGVLQTCGSIALTMEPRQTYGREDGRPNERHVKDNNQTTATLAEC